MVQALDALVALQREHALHQPRLLLLQPRQVKHLQQDVHLRLAAVPQAAARPAAWPLAFGRARQQRSGKATMSKQPATGAALRPVTSPTSEPSWLITWLQ